MDSQSRFDPVEPLYDRRLRGACMISTVAGQRVHLHGGCWVAPCGAEPPRLMVAFPQEFEGAQIVRRSGRFAVSLTSREQRDWHEAFFAGQHHIAAPGSPRFLRTAGGCPVPADAVAYFDCRLVHARDLGDFLLAVGAVQDAAVLHASYRNLSVNEIIAGHDPRGRQEAQLPYNGFDFDCSVLQAAPVQAAGLTPSRFEEVYLHRQWGLFLVSSAWAGRGHVFVTSWCIQTSHRPPRMAACFPTAWEAASWVAERRAPFAMTLLAKEHADFVRRYLNGGQDPNAHPAGSLACRPADGLYVLPGGVAYFVCSPEQVWEGGSVRLVIGRVEEWAELCPDRENLSEQDVAPLRAEAVAAGHWREPAGSFPLPVGAP